MKKDLIDERDYAEKGTWRRWLWNRIAERLPRPARECNAVYLAASRNLDGAVAQRKNFLAKNLYPVERDAKKIRALRKGGILAIHDDVFNVIGSFGQQIDVVNLDFCGGLNKSTVSKLHRLMFFSHTRAAVFALNFLRGWDFDGSSLRAWASSEFESPATKLRGELFFKMILASWMGSILKRNPDPHLRSRARDEADLVAADMLPAFTSYKSSSGNMYFDSVVFVSPARNAMRWDGDDNELAELDRRDIERATVPCSVRKIAAFRAHQTMRAGR